MSLFDSSIDLRESSSGHSRRLPKSCWTSSEGEDGGLEENQFLVSGEGAEVVQAVSEISVIWRVGRML